MNQIQVKPIEGFPGYFIFNCGVVSSSARKKPRILNAYPNPGGYKQIKMQKRCKQHTLGLHRLIALAFIPNPNNKPHINHINGVVSDNRIENLEWVTHRENMVHSFEKLGRKGNIGSKNGRAKLRESDIPKIRMLLKKGLSQLEISKNYTVSKTVIQLIKERKIWNHVLSK